MTAVAPPGGRVLLQLFGDVPAEEAAVTSRLQPREVRPTIPDGGRLTLEQRLTGAWEGLLAAGEADCPVCQGRLVRSGSSGLCESCGTSIA